MRRQCFQHLYGFTLVELLGMIDIIPIFAALLLPAGHAACSAVSPNNCDANGIWGYADSYPNNSYAG